LANKKIPKELAKKKINDFFMDIKNKEASQVWKIKKFAMKQRISLKDNKQMFCKKCLKPYIEPKIRIKSGYKTITCENCGVVKRIKL
jgi:RNase P subunit RPR2